LKLCQGLCYSTGVQRGSRGSSSRCVTQIANGYRFTSSTFKYSHNREAVAKLMPRSPLTNRLTIDCGMPLPLTMAEFVSSPVTCYPKCYFMRADPLFVDQTAQHKCLVSQVFTVHSNVVQLSLPDWGSKGRWFESSRPAFRSRDLARGCGLLRFPAGARQCIFRTG
jgi:hypothetical protein